MSPIDLSCGIRKHIPALGISLCNWQLPRRMPRIVSLSSGELKDKVVKTYSWIVHIASAEKGGAESKLIHHEIYCRFTDHAIFFGFGTSSSASRK